MNDHLFIPLKGGDVDPKKPVKPGWTAADYSCGLDEALRHSGWVGMRCDNLVVIDCDDAAAIERAPGVFGLTDVYVTTPRGVHFFYAWSPGSPIGPSVGVLPHTDIRAGSTSYVVVPPTPGYVISAVRAGQSPSFFDPATLPRRQNLGALAGRSGSDETWTTVPEGVRNATLASLGGWARKHGMAQHEIKRLLLAFNQGWIDPQLDDAEVGKVAWSVSRYVPDPTTRSQR